ncbi:hypothetical protein SAMN05192533_101501 [Mesobacillus persicus]|uniref:Uncharacterized protein n=1 Tax=Mesobacillus persicus TaxID=930146 RepID=A0A1H7WM97_9BACI|nr:hypothetical protein [Mesobacillus persicus]SEM22686.1 hypothetical protein SAMN05192533_101501 [Mesobacillus persicus]
MEKLIGLLLGSFDLFYPLLIVSVFTLIYALVKRSWILMIISAILLYPDAWYFSGYPPFYWVQYIPVIHILLATNFYLRAGKKKDT